MPNSSIKPCSDDNTRPFKPRRKMELSIRFRIRTNQRNDVAPRNLQIRLTVDGVTTSDYVSNVRVRPAKWNQEDQLVTGKDSTATDLNEQLDRIVLAHRDIFRELKSRYARGEGPRPTAELVKLEFTRPGSSTPTLIEFYEKYLEYLDTLHGTDDERAGKTLDRAYKVRDYINEFSDIPRLIDLKTGWAKRFHAWLQIHPVTNKRRMNKDTANKYLGHVRDAVNYAIDEGYLANNPLDKFRPKRGKTKPVYFLEKAQVVKLMGMETTDEQLGYVLWWSSLMCLTGLDYKDAIRYARNRTKFERLGASGWKIVIERSKPPYILCEIPMLQLVKTLFDPCPEGPHAPILADVNRHLKVIGAQLGMPPEEKLTSKILRKSAGAYFLELGLTMEAVSRMLGHTSVRTTEQFYVKVKSSYMDSEMRRIGEQRGGGTTYLFVSS